MRFSRLFQNFVQNKTKNKTNIFFNCKNFRNASTFPTFSEHNSKQKKNQKFVKSLGMFRFFFQKFQVYFSSNTEHKKYTPRVSKNALLYPERIERMKVNKKWNIYECYASDCKMTSRGNTELKKLQKALN